MNKKDYRIRRGIVRALFDYAGAQDLETIACHMAVMVENPTPQELREAWDALVSAGVIVPLPGYDAVAILPTGIREQMKQSNGIPPQIAVLYGPGVI